MRLQGLLHWHPSSPSLPLLRAQQFQLNLYCCHLRPFASWPPDINHTPVLPDPRRLSQARPALRAPPSHWSTIQLKAQEQSGLTACLLTACGRPPITKTSTLAPARPRPGSRVGQPRPACSLAVCTRLPCWPSLSLPRVGISQTPSHQQRS